MVYMAVYGEYIIEATILYYLESSDFNWQHKIAWLL